MGREILRRDGSQFRDDVEWWKRKLNDRPKPFLLSCHRSSSRGKVWSGPLRGGDGAQSSPGDGILKWRLDPELCQQLDRLGQTEKTTEFVTRLAVFVAQLAFETGQREILLGTYVLNRSRLALQSIHGCFVNLVVLRFQFEPDITFREWLAIVRRAVSEAEVHGAIPFELLCDELERSGEGRPAIEVIFNTSPSEREIEFSDLKMVWMAQRFETMPWGFTMSLEEQSERYDSRVSFDANIHDPIGVKLLIDRYKNLLDVASRNPDGRLSELLANVP